MGGVATDSELSAPPERTRLYPWRGETAGPARQSGRERPPAAARAPPLARLAPPQAPGDSVTGGKQSAACGATRRRRRGCSPVARRQGRRGDCEGEPLRHSCATVDPRSTAVICPARAVPPELAISECAGGIWAFSVSRGRLRIPVAVLRIPRVHGGFRVLGVLRDTLRDS